MMTADDFQRFKLTVAYDGRPFSGWQSQPDGNTVQDVLLTALQAVCPKITDLQGSGRTDARVSADGQAAHFDAPTAWSMDARAWRKALNSKLPATIRILAAEPVAHDFHARFSAKAKTYRYRIFIGEVFPPLYAGLVWHQHRIANFETIREAIALFEGTHDFRAFCAKRHDGHDEERDTTRTIHSATLHKISDDECEIEFTGSGFLYKMVRFLVGAAFQCEQGKRTHDEIQNQLQSGIAFETAPFCAPSDGLRLVKVGYSHVITS